MKKNTTKKIVIACIAVILSMTLAGCGNSPKSAKIIGNWYVVCETPESSWDNITFNSKSEFYSDGLTGNYTRQGQSLCLQYPLVGARNLTIDEYDGNIVLVDDQTGKVWASDPEIAYEFYEALVTQKQ